MAMPNLPLNSTYGQPADDSMLIEARARWNPDLSPAKARPLVRAIEQADAQTLPGLLAQMELLCSVLDAETDPEPELSQRLASKVRVTLQHLVAASAAQAVDPHIEWWRQSSMIRDLNDAPGLNDAVSDVLGDRMSTLYDLIAETPAETVAGVCAQLRLAHYCAVTWDGDRNEPVEAALRNAVATLERLASGRAPA